MHAVLVAANLEMVEHEVIELAEVQTELALPHIQTLEAGHRQVPHKVHRQMAPQAEDGFSLDGQWSTPFTQIVKPSMAMSWFHVRVCARRLTNTKS